MKVAIIGYGIDGRSAAAYWRHMGDEVTICDQNEQLRVPDFAEARLGPGYLKNLHEFDVIVRSSGIRPSVILAGNPRVGRKITTTMNEFLRVCPTKKVIGITGTKGKGTTSTLVAKMLEAAGEEVFLGGNIGVSPLDFLPQLTADSFVVLEMSSFQLFDLKYSPYIGVCLMVVPEHLNWHPDMEDYVAAKSNLFAHQTSRDIAIYFADNSTSHRIASASRGAKLTYFAPPGAYVADGQIMIDNQIICKTDELHLLGPHNWENACAAATVLWQFTPDVIPIRKVLTTFAGLPHRLELVRKKDGVRYYNDSFAATPDAAIAALKAIPGHKVMILGGFDRGLPLGHVAKAVLQHKDEIRKIVVIGAGGPRLITEFDKAGFNNYEFTAARTMSEIVAAARHHAQSGDAIVLSPGFTSFDMFKNFEERGDLFMEVVESL